MAGLGGAGPLACRDFPGSFITKTTCLPGRAIGEIRFLPGALRDSRAREIGPGDSSNFVILSFLSGFRHLLQARRHGVYGYHLPSLN
jgi:hypothetical protein